ncbi:MAG: hypothetical protein KGL39_12755 [Patescibacteria group bacterium]|nr:hypothetical protein [Patescibacteria group bacterium]
MNRTDPPRLLVAKVKNGDVVRYDRIEEHDADGVQHRLFFRAPIGLVYSTTHDNVLDYNFIEKDEA